MKITYSEAFIEQALVKVFSRGDRTVRSVAEYLSVSFHTLKNWMIRKSMGKLSVSVTKEKTAPGLERGGAAGGIA
ncbi:MAG: transposase [Gammaproteobacteria bacterium]